MNSLTFLVDITNFVRVILFGSDYELLIKTYSVKCSVSSRLQSGRVGEEAGAAGVK